MDKFHNFKIGDQVQLKAGGPPMTVVRGSKYSPAVACNWFLGNSFYSEDFIYTELQFYAERLDNTKPIGPMRTLPSKLQK